MRQHENVVQGEALPQCEALQPLIFAERVTPSAEQNGGSGTRKIGVFGFTPLKLGKRQFPAMFSALKCYFCSKIRQLLMVWFAGQWTGTEKAMLLYGRTD